MTKARRMLLLAAAVLCVALLMTVRGLRRNWLSSSSDCAATRYAICAYVANYVYEHSGLSSSNIAERAMNDLGQAGRSWRVCPERERRAPESCRVEGVDDYAIECDVVNGVKTQVAVKCLYDSRHGTAVYGDGSSKGIVVRIPGQRDQSY